MEKSVADHSYQFQVVKYEVIEGKYAVFYIKAVVAPFNISFLFKDRYSGLQNWQAEVRKSLEISTGLPVFPGKKWFGNTDRDFLKKRQDEI